MQIEQELPLHLRPRYVWATLSWSKNEDYPRATCKKDTSIRHKLFNIMNANALLMLPAKTPEVEVLEVLSFVPAILTKFPTSHI